MSAFVGPLGAPFDPERFRARSRANRAAYDQTDGRCFYCGGAEASVSEHKTPKVRGGGNEPENRVLSCVTCNARKGIKTVEEFRIFLMLHHGRPPVAFFGEPVRVERDWLIISSRRSSPPRSRDEIRRSMAETRRAGNLKGMKAQLAAIAPYMGTAP